MQASLNMSVYINHNQSFEKRFLENRSMKMWWEVKRHLLCGLDLLEYIVSHLLLLALTSFYSGSHLLHYLETTEGTYLFLCNKNMICKTTYSVNIIDCFYEMFVIGTLAKIIYIIYLLLLHRFILMQNSIDFHYCLTELLSTHHSAAFLVILEN